MIRAVIVHGVTDATRPDEQDTLDQVREIAAALARLDYTTETRALSLDLTPLAELAAHDSGPSPIVFNLVEALAGDGRLIHLAPAAMEHHRLAFTGSGASAITISTDKQLTKRLLRAAGIPTPSPPTVDSRPGARYIVKSLMEDASFGLDAGSVVAAAEVDAEIAARTARFGGSWFAEAYIEGREFNLSILEDEHGAPHVLPIAEIVFQGYAAGRPRIVDYEAKWDTASHAYHNTPRRFLAPDEDASLVRELTRHALAAWREIGLSGYGRIDFRVDSDGICYVLEANANPCLASDAGFAAAATTAGMSYDALIRRIVSRARRHDMPARTL